MWPAPYFHRKFTVEKWDARVSLDFSLVLWLERDAYNKFSAIYKWLFFISMGFTFITFNFTVYAYVYSTYIRLGSFCFLSPPKMLYLRIFILKCRDPSAERTAPIVRFNTLAVFIKFPMTHQRRTSLRAIISAKTHSIVFCIASDTSRDRKTTIHVIFRRVAHWTKRRDLRVCFVIPTEYYDRNFSRWTFVAVPSADVSLYLYFFTKNWVFLRK